MQDLTEALYADAVRITAGAGYVNAGTVEFLVDPKTWNHYFIEVNPRIQVEHTVTEVITGVDLVQSQIRVAAGQKLPELGLTQDNISMRGYAIQARVTTEDPAEDFRPDTGQLQVWRAAEGFGIRLDGGNAYPGATISPHYDSMLMKVTGSALTFEGAADKVPPQAASTRIAAPCPPRISTAHLIPHAQPDLCPLHAWAAPPWPPSRSHPYSHGPAQLTRALTETRIRGVKTNMPFIRNVLAHPEFISGEATTSFIADEHERLFDFTAQSSSNRGQKLLNYLGGPPCPLPLPIPTGPSSCPLLPYCPCTTAPLPANPHQHPLPAPYSPPTHPPSRQISSSTVALPLALRGPSLPV